MIFSVCWDEKRKINYFRKYWDILYVFFVPISTYSSVSHSFILPPYSIVLFF